MNEPLSKSATASNDDWFNAAQLVLSEKRTAFSLLRTGAAIFVLPLSVGSLLIATAKSYQNAGISHLMIPVLIICAGLAILAIYLITRSLKHIHHYDKMLGKIKQDHPILSEYLD